MEEKVVHGSFTVERDFDVSADRVFAAFSTKASKEKWFKGPYRDKGEHTLDFRPSGHETNRGTFQDGIEHRYEATYYDIVPNERIIYAYEMFMDEKRISVSLATITLEESAGKTRLVLHEDGVFLDGLDGADVREEGTKQLLEALADTL